MNIKIISEVIKNSYGIVNRVVKNLKSTDGNVYDVFTQDGRYIVKIYNDLKHVNKMIRIVDTLNVNNIKVPNIIGSSCVKSLFPKLIFLPFMLFST